MAAEVPLNPVSALKSLWHSCSFRWVAQTTTPRAGVAPPVGRVRAMSELHVLRVFTTPQGEHGNGLGVFLRGEDVPQEQRQAVAADLGFAETVFVDDRERAELRILTPQL